MTTPDGRVWYVRRRWARRQPPWRRRADHELGPAELDDLPLLPADEVADSFLRFVRYDVELGIWLLLGLAVVGVVAAVAGAVLVVERVVPFLVDHAVVIGAGLAGLAAVAEGRIDSEHGVIVFTDPSSAP